MRGSAEKSKASLKQVDELVDIEFERDRLLHTCARGEWGGGEGGESVPLTF